MSAGYKIQVHRQLVRKAQEVHITADSTVTVYNYLSSGLLNYKLRNMANGPNEKTSYGYDNLYRPNWISIAGKHAQSFVYDQWDRIIQSNDTIEGSKVFVNKTEYDLLGRIKKDIYPSGYYTLNEYDKYGILTSVKDRSGQLIWQALNENAKGQIKLEKKGNIQTHREYDERGFPMYAETPPAVGAMYWIFDDKGNLESRGDHYMQSERFLYDTQNRLTNCKLYDTGNFIGQSSIIYDPDNGNILEKTDLGSVTLSYGENGKPPHALTSISGVPAQFPSDNLNVTYTDFKKIKTLEQGNKFYELTYGTDEQRRKSEYKVNNVTQETRYYLGDYEEVSDAVGVTKKLHYLSGGAILIITGNTETLYYGYYDHLGSLIALTDKDGTVVERYAFDPWGNRRNPTNWTQADSRISWIVNRGFTMHEHLDVFGIINMNGRVYDPLTAQFFSPDPYVQAPGNWVNYDRYLYAMNNPFKYTDPSGEFLGLAFRELAFIAEFSSNLIHGRNNSLSNAWKQSGKATNEVGSCLQIPVYQDNHTIITAGLDPFGLGVSANVSYMKNGHAVGGSVGFGLTNGFHANAGYSYTTDDGWSFGGGIGAGSNYWGWNASVTKNGVGAGYGRTYFGGENAQTLGNWSIYWRGGSFSLQNDVRFWKLGGDGGDRWRTNAFELTFGDFSIGSSLFTNDGRDASVGAEGTNDKGIDYNAVAPGFLMGKNRPIKGEQAGAWKNGQVYSAPLWLSYRVGNSVSRVGFSHWRVQNATQNFVHRWIGRQQYYLGYNNLYQGFYGYSGYYNPFSLYPK